MATFGLTEDRYRDLFVTGLKNAHAMEHQALSIMTPQAERIQHYPELAERLREHIAETNGQLARVDEILDQLNEKASALKDLGLGIVGELAAVGHSFAGDEILKNSFANHAFENFEIASYTSLITLASDRDFGQFVPALEQNLREEQAMAEWCRESIPMITRRYAELYVNEGASAAKV
jgi:ferritin-like metal-binding protein YciE